MNSILHSFFQPQHQIWRVRFSFMGSAYYFLFFYYFEPFKTHFDDYTRQQLLLNYFFLAAIVFTCSFVCLVLIPYFFPKWFLSESYTSSKIFFLIATGTFVATILDFIDVYYFLGIEFTFPEFFHFVISSVLPTVIFINVPIFIVYLFIFNYFNEKEKTELSNLTQFENNALEETSQYEDDKKPEIFHFTDTSNKKNFHISSDNLLYITSAQNYIEIHYQKKDSTKGRLVLRNSLKFIEQELNLDMQTLLIRCHKTFIINREKVLEFRGSSKAAYFMLENVEEPIPISRQKYAELEPQFNFLYQQKM
jgi:hypothetical protein